MMAHFEDFDKCKENLICVGPRNSVMYLRGKDGHFARLTVDEKITAVCCDKQVFKLETLIRGRYIKFGGNGGSNSGDDSESDDGVDREEEKYFRMFSLTLTNSAKSSVYCNARNGQLHVGNHDIPERGYAEMFAFKWACTLVIALYPTGDSPTLVIRKMYHSWPLILPAQESDYVNNLLGYLTKFQIAACRTSRVDIDGLIDKAGKDSLDKFMCHLLQHHSCWEAPRVRRKLQMMNIFLI